LHVRAVGAAFAIFVVQKKGLTSSALAGFDIAPTVAHDVAAGEVDIPTARGLEQEARPGFAAEATVGVIVRADAHIVELQVLLKLVVDLGDLFGGGGAAGDVRLIGDEDQRETGFAEFAAGFADSVQQAEIGKRYGRVGLSIAEDSAIDDSIAIEEDGAGCGGMSHGVSRTTLAADERR